MQKQITISLKGALKLSSLNTSIAKAMLIAPFTPPTAKHCNYNKKKLLNFFRNFFIYFLKR